jgi:putative phosphoribosyl transferase
MIFRDRRVAGEQLATRLQFLADQPDVIVLGIPRGGVVVAAEVARALNVSLDVFIARKLGAPVNPELAIGAVTSTGDVFIDDEIVHELRIPKEIIDREVEYQRKEIERRLYMYRPDRPPLNVKNKTVVLIDDGIATGSTVLASLRSLHKQAPTKLILAVPVAPAETMKRLEQECDQAIVLATPEPFLAVGRFYLMFDQTSDEEVVALLADSNLRR